MKVERKSDITIANFNKHDELVTYSASSGSCESLRRVNLRGGHTFYIRDFWNGKTLTSTKYTSLAAAKKAVTVNHF